LYTKRNFQSLEIIDAITSGILGDVDKLNHCSVHLDEIRFFGFAAICKKISCEPNTAIPLLNLFYLATVMISVAYFLEGLGSKEKIL
jgi:hypothetical protein